MDSPEREIAKRLVETCVAFKEDEADFLKFMEKGLEACQRLSEEARDHFKGDTLEELIHEAIRLKKDRETTQEKLKRKLEERMEEIEILESKATLQEQKIKELWPRLLRSEASVNELEDQNAKKETQINELEQLVQRIKKEIHEEQMKKEKMAKVIGDKPQKEEKEDSLQEPRNAFLIYLEDHCMAGTNSEILPNELASFASKWKEEDESIKEKYKKLEDDERNEKMAQKSKKSKESKPSLEEINDDRKIEVEKMLEAKNKQIIDLQCQIERATRRLVDSESQSLLRKIEAIEQELLESKESQESTKTALNTSEEKIKSLVKKKKSYKLKFKESKRKNNLLKDKTKKIELENNSLTSENQNKTQELSDSKMKLEETNAELNSSQDKVQELVKINESQKEEIRETKRILEQTKSILKSHEEQIRSLREVEKTKDQQLIETKSDLEKTSASLRASLEVTEGLKSKIEELEWSLEDQTGCVDQLKKKLEKKKRKFSEKIEKLNLEVEKRFMGFRVQADKETKKLGEMGKQKQEVINGLEEQKRALEVENENMRRELSKAQLQKEEEKEIIEQNKKMKLRIRDLESEMEDLQKEFLDMTKKNEQLESLRNENEKMKGSNGPKEQEMNGKGSNNQWSASFLDEKAQLEFQIKDLKQMLDEKNKISADLFTRIQKTHEEKLRMKAKYKKKIEEQAVEIEYLIEAIEKLENNEEPGVLEPEVKGKESEQEKEADKKLIWQLQEEIKDLRREIKSLMQKADDKPKPLMEKSENVSELIAVIRNGKKDLENCVAELAIREAENSDLKKQNQEFKKEVEKKNLFLKEAQEEAQKTREEFASKLKVLSNKMEENAKGQEIQNEQGALNELRHEVQRLKRELDAEKEVKNQIQRMLSSQSETASKFRRENEILSNEIENLKRAKDERNKAEHGMKRDQPIQKESALLLNPFIERLSFAICTQNEYNQLNTRMQGDLFISEKEFNLLVDKAREQTSQLKEMRSRVLYLESLLINQEKPRPEQGDNCEVLKSENEGLKQNIQALKIRLIKAENEARKDNEELAREVSLQNANQLMSLFDHPEISSREYFPFDVAMRILHSKMEQNKFGSH